MEGGGLSPWATAAEQWLGRLRLIPVLPPGSQISDHMIELGGSEFPQMLAILPIVPEVRVVSSAMTQAHHGITEES